MFLDWLKGPYRPPTRYQDPELSARLSFAGFMTVDEVIRLLESEISTRREEITRYRDRNLARDPALPFDHTPGNFVGTWEHETGAAGNGRARRGVRDVAAAVAGRGGFGCPARHPWS
ncbi:hypothetical protein [Amycolatopsis dongchuanensis]|uniref:Uncharacterized protein n=1 Tax=Amycolatopsis dongchuanensis TaxID=1070866 RepID=A0ABP9R890_9PSEU